MFTITEQQVRQLANYLAKQPYSEVFTLINLLTKLPRVEETKTPDKEANVKQT